MHLHALVFLLAYFRLKESLMFLLGKGKAEDSLDAILCLLGGDTHFAEEEMLKLSRAVNTESSQSHTVTLCELLSVRGTTRALTHLSRTGVHSAPLWNECDT
jgi:hypothetical protein